MSYYLLLKLTQTLRVCHSGLNICRITFCSNYRQIDDFANAFEYMSYYLLLKLGHDGVLAVFV